MTITGPTKIGRFTHIGANTCIFGGAGVEIGDYVGISPGVKIFSSTENVDGHWVTNPTVPKHMRNPICKPIRIADHTGIGANSVLLPGADMPEGSFLGAMSLIKSPLSPWSIWAGVPASYKKARAQKVRALVSNNAPA